MTKRQGMEVAEGPARRSSRTGWAGSWPTWWPDYRQDVRTILAIPTMRYALVGVSTVLFVVTAVATWMPNFYQNQLHLSQQAANGAFGALAILGGIPGTLIGGRMADRWVNRFLGARVVIPAACISVSATCS